MHIFWQRRIREGDASTPWWFPAKTDQGAMREDRLVLPIPPGLHWRDEMPVLVGATLVSPEGETSLAPTNTPKPRRAKATAVPMEAPVRHGPRQYGAPPPVLAVAEKVAEKMAEKIKPPKKEKAKVDPKRVAAARELRDRYLEQVNSAPDALPTPDARYDVSRALPAAAGPSAMQIEAKPLRQLPSAA